MSLQKTSKLLLGFCAAGLALLIILATWTQREIASYHSLEKNLIDLKLRMDDFSVGSDQLMLFHVDHDTWLAFRADAMDLRAELDHLHIDESYVKRAKHHITQLIETLEHYYSDTEVGSRDTARTTAYESYPQVSLEARLAMNRVANHGVALDTALDYLVGQKQLQIESYSHNVLSAFIFASLLFAMLSVIAFSSLNKRLVNPVSSLANTIRSINESNNLDKRANLEGQDEIAQLGKAFDKMMDIQQNDKAQIEQQAMQIAAQSQLLEFSAEIASLGGWRYNLKDQSIAASKIVREIHGLAEDTETTLEDILAAYTPTDRLGLETCIYQCAEDGQAFDEIFEISHSEQNRSVRCLGQPTIENGQVTQIIGAFQDVSERRRLELQLDRSQRMEAVGRLTGGVAHDFNNLLTVIIGNSELLNEDLENEDDKQLVDTILQAANRGANLTKSLLAFARKQPLKPEVINITRTVQELRPILVKAISESIQLDIISDDNNYLAEVDTVQFESALLNLVVNANDAMPGGGELIIETNLHEFDEAEAAQYELKPGKYVRMAVSDNGVGIAAADLNRIIEPFYTTKSKGKGTGLGLSTVYGFVKQSHGHLNIYSEQEKGTTVKIYLPMIKDGQETETSQADFEKPVDRSQSAEGKTILVVEDDERLNDYVTNLLQKYGYKVISAMNGPEAVNVIKSDADISLLFTDVIMPGGMNGQELAHVAAENRPEIKILFTSGYTENAIIHHGRLEPGVDLLQKPYTPNMLKRKIEAVFD